jgi:hypothetical protein
MIVWNESDRRPDAREIEHDVRPELAEQLHDAEHTAAKSEAYCMVQFPGQFFAIHGQEACFEQLQYLHSLGFRCTRVDVACDLWPHAGMIDKARAAFRRRELCHAKNHTTKDKQGSGEGMKGITSYFGERGRAGSGRLVCIYDKGLQTGKMDQGEWERWETRFSGSCACEVGFDLARCKSFDDMIAVAKHYAFGAVDFRQVVPGETSLKRRPRAKWWADFLGTNESLPMVKEPRMPPELERTIAWIKRSVAPTLVQASLGLGITDAEVWSSIIEPELKDKILSASLRPVVWEWVRFQKQVAEEMDSMSDG